MSKITDPQRSPEQIQGCINNRNKCAVAAEFICGCIPIPPNVGAILTGTCRFACFVFVETLRQDCESCCEGADHIIGDVLKPGKNISRVSIPIVHAHHLGVHNELG